MSGDPLRVGIIGFGGLERRFEREVVDKVLVRVVEIMRDRLRELDQLARVGDAVAVAVDQGRNRADREVQGANAGLVGGRTGSRGGGARRRAR